MGKVSDDFLGLALKIFVGFWSIVIFVGLVFFGYVLFTLRSRENRRKKSGRK